MKWIHVMKINDIIRKFESFAHTEWNMDNNKNDDFFKCIKDGQNILNDDD